MSRYQIKLENTNFKHQTHFSLALDQFHTYPSRDCAIIINNPNIVDQLQRDGFDVRFTAPGENDDPQAFMSKAYVYATTKYKVDGVNVQRDPDIYLVDPSRGPLPIRMDAGTVHQIDSISLGDISKINVILNAAINRAGRPVLYVEVLYIYITERDPWAKDFAPVMP
jgi:hypothetical protein